MRKHYSNKKVIIHAAGRVVYVRCTVIVFTWRGSWNAAVLFVRVVSTIIVSVTDVPCWNAAVVSTLERVWAARWSCRQHTKSHHIRYLYSSVIVVQSAVIVYSRFPLCVQSAVYSFIGKQTGDTSKHLSFRDRHVLHNVVGYYDLLKQRAHSVGKSERGFLYKKFSRRNWDLRSRFTDCRCSQTLLPYSFHCRIRTAKCLSEAISTVVSGVVWYNGSITPRVHSGVIKQIDCRLHYRPFASVE